MEKATAEESILIATLSTHKELFERLDNDETLIQQTANNVLIKATKNDTTSAQGGRSIIESLINVAPEGVQISAEKVNIAGATIFTSGRLSEANLDNTYDANGAAASVAKQIPDDISQLTDSTGVIPSNVSDLTNDTGFITSSSLPINVSDLNNDTGFITSSSLPTKVSDLTNDSGFQNSNQVSTAINNATSSLASKSDAIQSVTTETQYRLSNNSDSLTGSGQGYTWDTKIPTWSTNKYLWTRIATTYTPISGSSHTEYKPGTQQNEYGVYDSQLTTALSNASTALTNAGIAQSTANSAANTIITTQEYRLSNSPTELSGSGQGYTSSPTRYALAP